MFRIRKTPDRSIRTANRVGKDQRFWSPVLNFFWRTQSRKSAFRVAARALLFDDRAVGALSVAASAPMAARVSSRYEMGQTTRSEWEKDMKEHRELLRNVIEEHREGRDGGVMDWSDIAAELAFEEEKVYPPVSMLASSNPPSVVKGKSGWIYHSTSLGCLRPYHLPRRLAINVVESAVFDPFILLTIMVNCTTMAWASPMDPPGTQKQDILAVRCRRR